MSSTCQRKPKSLWGKQCSLSAGMVHCSNSKVPPLHSMLCQGQINMASYHYPRESTKNQSHSKYYVSANEGTATSV